MGKRRGAYRVLMEKAVGKRPFRRPRCRWENNIKMYFQELEWRFVDWIVQAPQRGSWRAVVNTVMNLRSA
jgi:hypothetical protein